MNRAMAVVFVVAPLAVACSDSPAGAPRPVVQLVSIDPGVSTVDCNDIIPNPDSVYINIHMVNTMPVDVPISTVGTWGFVLRTSNDSGLNAVAMDIPSLPIVPESTYLAARVGDVTFRTSMPTTAVCRNNPYRASFRDIQTSVRVTTPVGQYVSLPFTLRLQ
jgi:hypothetical protein